MSEAKPIEMNLLHFSLGDTASVPTPDSHTKPETSQKAQIEQSTVSFKVEATLSEVNVIMRHSHKDLADIKVRGTESMRA